MFYHQDLGQGGRKTTFQRLSSSQDPQQFVFVGGRELISVRVPGQAGGVDSPLPLDARGQD